MSGVLQGGVLPAFFLSGYIGRSYVYKELGKIDKDVYRIADAKIGIEPSLLDNPAELDR